MYRTPTHESRYKQRTRDRESKGRAGRYEEPRESSEGSSTEDDEESTDRYTEDSEDTTESQRGGRRNDVCSADSSIFERERTFTRYRPEEVLMRAYCANEKVKKHDKITQKNFLSPFPSFLIPPIYRDMSGRPNYRLTSANPDRASQDYMRNCGRPVKSSPRDTYEDENYRCSHRCHREKRLNEQPREKREQKHLSSKGYKPERILTCLQGESSLGPSSGFMKNQQSPECVITTLMENRRRQNSPPREKMTDHMQNSSRDRLQNKENQAKTKSGAMGRNNQSAGAVRELIRTAQGPGEMQEKICGPGQVREKLVYVVEEEEEGKKVTKLETDLFSVNEILTIKKDLLELSEFAKKLKKLKEMKKDMEKGKANKNSCQCGPVAELLKDVNKRIEALEARQEELEKGSLKTGQKCTTELESDKTTEQRASSNSPPKVPVVRQQSALTTALSIPKTDMILSKVGFSNNSDIANELMDIKNQLQKLEKRRMSETTPEAGPLGKSKPANKKDLGIAVFSSRTYILTSENYKKKSEGGRIREKEKPKDYLSGVEKPISKTEQIQENVCNWLRNVSPDQERGESDIARYLDMDTLEEEKGSLLATCDNSTLTRLFKDSFFENKEPQKNRASTHQKSAKNDDVNLEVLKKNDRKSSGEQTLQLNYQECFLTSSGKVFLVKSHEHLSKELPVERKVATKPVPPVLKSSPKKIRRSASSGSVPSAILTKDRAGRFKARAAKEVVRDSPKMMASPFESMQELTGTSSSTKDQKAVENINMKKLLSVPSRDKIHKESKNNIVKKLERNMMTPQIIKKAEDLRSSSSYSQLLGTVELDVRTTEKTSESYDRQDNADRDMQIYSLGTVTKLNFKALDDKCPPRNICKDLGRRRRIVVEPLPLAVKKVPEPDCPKFEEPSTSVKCEEPKISIELKERHCPCQSCCRKRLKEPPLCKEIVCKEPSVETGSSATTNDSELTESKRCKRKRKKQERLEKKQRKKREKLRDAEDRRIEKRRRSKERKEERKCRSKERQEERKCRSKERQEERRRRSKERQLQRKCRSKERLEQRRCRSQERLQERKCKKEKKNRVREKRSKEREMRRRSRECIRKRSKECNRKRSEECVKRKSQEKIKCKESKESKAKCKIKKSKCSFFKGGSQLFHRCQKLIRSQSERSDCQLEESFSSEVVDTPCEEYQPVVNENDFACSATLSQNTEDIYSRAQKEVPNVEREKLDDSCMFGSFFKTLRRLYPKFSNLQFGNFSGDIGEKKISEPRTEGKIVISEVTDEESFSDDDGESANTYGKASYRQSSLENMGHRYYHQDHHRHFHDDSSPSAYHHDTNHVANSEHLRNCKCVRVYLQTQKCQKWPGVFPFRSLSQEKADEISCSDTPETSKTIKSDFIFPGRLPESQVIGHCREDRCKKCCDRKCELLCGRRVEPKCERRCEKKVEPKCERIICERRVEPKCERKCEKKVEPKCERICERKVEPKCERIVCERKVEPKCERICERKVEPKCERIVCERKVEPKCERICERKVEPKCERIICERRVDSKCERKLEKKCLKTCRKRCRKCCPKYKKPRHRRKDKCSRRRRKEKRSTARLCACVRCGNVHEKIVLPIPPNVDNRCVGEPEEPEDRCKTEQQSSPMFSFLRNFCKNKSSKKSIFQKLSEVRHLKTCSGKKKNKCCEEPKKFSLEAQNVRSKERNVCEEEYFCCCERVPKPKKKRRRKVSCECPPIEIKCEKPPKKKKCKKKYCECFEICTEPLPKPPQVDYCACPALFTMTNPMTVMNVKESSEVNDTLGNVSNNETIEISGTNETSESVTTKTMTTTTTTTTAEEEKSLTISRLESDLRRKDSRLKEKLSSIQFLLRSIRKFKKSKRRMNTEPNLKAECSECSPKAVYDLKMKSSSFIEKIKRLGENRREKKKKEGINI